MIPGITTRVRYQRLGKIRLGEKAISRGGAEYPKATDHFVFDEAAAAIGKVYGDKCVLIAPVMLPGNPKRAEHGWDFESFWKTSRSAYGKASGLFCRCIDGETATRVNKGLVKETGKPIDRQGWDALQLYQEEKKITVDVGEMFDMACPGTDCPLFENKTCKNLGSLDVMLPKVAGFGVWTVQTSSFNSIRNIESVLQQIADTLGGQLTGIPLALRLVPQQAQVEGKAKTIFVLELLCPYNLSQLVGLRRKALSEGGAITAAIEASDDTPDDLYAQGGAVLDKELKVAAAPAAEPPPDQTHVDRARIVGEALGMSKAQVEIAIRKAGDMIGAMVDAWERDLEVKGGAVDDGTRDEPGEHDAGEGNPIYDQWAGERKGDPTRQEPTRPAMGGSVSTGVGKSPAVREAEERKREQAKKEKQQERAEAKKQEPLIAPRDTAGSAYDV